MECIRVVRGLSRFNRNNILASKYFSLSCFCVAKFLARIKLTLENHMVLWWSLQVSLSAMTLPPPFTGYKLFMFLTQPETRMQIMWTGVDWSC